MKRWVWILAACLLLHGCALTPDKSTDISQIVQMRNQQSPANWSFQGRLAVVADKDAFSASINWKHQSSEDEIELSGPLAQGKVLISVTPGSVAIDNGDQVRHYQGDADSVINAQLDIKIPVTALKYWVLGLTDPQQSYLALDNGFVQSGWQIRFIELQSVGDLVLPKKITVQDEHNRVKLIVDQWSLT
ncbi:outer membrane lipoprotein LolB [Methylomonas paludis]|uniref:Outer-membrane lipoprotein LolB n=1 Tax=Methylomonas paludis TaxID=1173101 RepID=A0A975MM29_9GAMM|nr:lipoprotein insertase outer membrane protein LolB [Methylomonas paludis]QWF70302.1 outer membrane lipoprotein LolB [Methylomonas paludis]